MAATRPQHRSLTSPATSTPLSPQAGQRLVNVVAHQVQLGPAAAFAGVHVHLGRGMANISRPPPVVDRRQFQPTSRKKRPDLVDLGREHDGVQPVNHPAIFSQAVVVKGVLHPPDGRGADVPVDLQGEPEMRSGPRPGPGRAGLRADSFPCPCFLKPSANRGGDGERLMVMAAAWSAAEVCSASSPRLFSAMARSCREPRSRNNPMASAALAAAAG